MEISSQKTGGSRHVLKNARKNSDLDMLEKGELDVKSGVKLTALFAENNLRQLEHRKPVRRIA